MSQTSIVSFNGIPQLFHPERNLPIVGKFRKIVADNLKICAIFAKSVFSRHAQLCSSLPKHKSMKKLSPKIRFLLFNLLAAFLLICGIAWYVLSCLDDYTRHGHFITVPVFYDLIPEEAAEEAAREHLKVQVIDSLYDEQARPGTVVEQYPSPGARVKENRLIHLTINASSPEKIALPNLINAAYRHTLQSLQTRGFKIGRIEYAPAEFRNLVIGLRYNDQDVHPGEMLPKGATIDIVLGSGNTPNTVFVPQLWGKTLAEATDLLRKSFLNIGNIRSDGSVSNGNEKYTAIVFQQYPPAQTAVEAGSPVDLEITLKKEKIQALDTLLVTE